MDWICTRPKIDSFPDFENNIYNITFLKKQFSSLLVENYIEGFLTLRIKIKFTFIDKL